MSEIRLFNTLSRRKEVFRPIKPGCVKLYVCGLTVYSEPHIGNWSIYIKWDILVRLLRQSGNKVEYVQNITDVGHLTSDDDSGDDKIAKAATENRTSAWDIAAEYIAPASHGRKLLNIIEPDYLPRATDYIKQQIDFVKQLETKAVTYEIPGDGIYFDSTKFSSYGELARLDITGLQSGARVVNNNKHSPTDFALWKFSPANQSRDMEWDSPWGRGFPGWRLECSVMILELLGEQIDIHAGGIDHIAVHHTNEIAQSETVTGRPLSRFWLHANHIKVDNQKMSKSTGNVYSLQDLAQRGYDFQAFRLLILESNYHTGSNFSWQLMTAAASRLKRWQSLADRLWQPLINDNSPVTTSHLSEELHQACIRAADRLADDLDTPGALQALESGFDVMENTAFPASDTIAIKRFIDFIDDYLGLKLNSEDIDADQKSLIAKRFEAKASGDYQTADQIRDELSMQGILLNDSDKGTYWSRSR